MFFIKNWNNYDSLVIYKYYKNYNILMFFIKNWNNYDSLVTFLTNNEQQTIQ